MNKNVSAKGSSQKLNLDYLLVKYNIIKNLIGTIRNGIIIFHMMKTSICDIAKMNQ